MGASEAFQLAVWVIQMGIKLEPALAKSFQKLFANGNPTDADYAAFRLEIQELDYFKFVPGSALPGNPNAPILQLPPGSTVSIPTATTDKP